jgi:acyl-CoA hydrolase
LPVGLGAVESLSTKERSMNNYTIVRPEHLNHHGWLFGGAMLQWVDEFAYLAASRDYPGCRLVTIAMDEIVFKHPAPNGSILRFHILPIRQGTTSVTYSVEVFCDAPGDMEEISGKSIFSTTVTFVSVGTDGSKQPLPRVDQPRSAQPPGA